MTTIATLSTSRPDRAGHVAGFRRSYRHTPQNELLPSCPNPVLANVANMDPKPYVLPPPATPPRRPPKRSSQLVGVHFESPKRRRPARKDSALVVRPGLAQREQELTARLDTLLGKSKNIAEDFKHSDSIYNTADVLDDGEDAQEPAQPAVPESVFDSIPVSSPHEKQTSTCRSVPSQTSQRLYDNWIALIPTLEDGYLSYMQRAQGRLGRQPPHVKPHHCGSRRCTTRTSPVQCLYTDCTFSLAN